MTLLNYAKQYHNFDVFLALVDDAGLTDDEIMTKFEVSKQRIYDARKRVDPMIEALKSIDNKPDKRNSDVQNIIDAFTVAFGTTKSSNYDRYAAKRLFVKHGDNVVVIINVLASHGGEEFCPVVNSVSELEKKLPSVMSFLKKQVNSNQVMSL